MATPAQLRSARTNGQLGGAPSKKMVELRRKARERAVRIVASQQEESVKFLVYVRDNPNAPVAERVRCALALLDRGEMPPKSANFYGLGTTDELDAMFGTPKLVILGKYGSEKGSGHESSEATDGEGSEAAASENRD